MLFLYTATVLLLFTAAGACAAGAFRRRIEWMLPITVMGYTLILFIAAFFDRLELGWNFLCASGAVLWSVAVARLCQSREFRKNFRENFLTPGFLLMIVSIPVLLSMTRTLTLVPLSDEFTHWGGAARELYLTDALPVFNKPTTVRFTDFPPATSLLQYIFFQALRKLFRRHRLFRAELSGGSAAAVASGNRKLSAFSLAAPVLVQPDSAAAVLL